MSTSLNETDFIAESIVFYEATASRYRIWFLLAKVMQLFITSLLPIISLLPVDLVKNNQPLIVGFAGALLLVIEGLQQTLQFQPLWIKYRATSSLLRREQMLHKNGAGPYAGTSGDATQKLFVERVDAIISLENTDWTHLQEKAVVGHK